MRVLEDCSLQNNTFVWLLSFWRKKEAVNYADVVVWLVKVDDQTRTETFLLSPRLV